MAKSFDPSEILRVLTAHRVHFIIVGGVAGTLAGSPLATRDLDVVYESDAANLERLSRALFELEAAYKDPTGRRIVPDIEMLARIRVNLLQTTAGDLDLLQTIGEGLAYSDLLPRTIEYEIDDLRIAAIDLPTLIEAKTVADRPKDHHALPFLRELLRLETGS